MIKKATILVAFIATLVTAQAQQALNIIAVDMDTLFRDFYEVRLAEERFKTTVDAAQKEIEDMVEKVRPIQESLQEQVGRARSDLLEEGVRREAAGRAQELDGQLRRAQQEIGQFQAQQRQTLDERRNAIISQNMDKIIEVVEQFAESKNADLVINTANRASFVFVAKSYDATAEVLAILNADAPSTPATSN